MLSFIIFWRVQCWFLIDWFPVRNECICNFNSLKISLSIFYLIFCFDFELSYHLFNDITYYRRSAQRLVLYSYAPYTYFVSYITYIYITYFICRIKTFIVWQIEFTEGICEGQQSDKGRKTTILSCAIACRASPFFIFGTHEYGATDKCSAEGACDCRCQEGVSGACNKQSSSKYNAFRITQSSLPGMYRMRGG